MQRQVLGRRHRAPHLNATMMPRFLIEVSHDPGPAECTQAIKVLLRSGSHFLTHADWGCKDGEHKAWMILELDSKQEALQIVPSDFRARTRVILLHAFTLEQVTSRAERGVQ